jgi:signal transduction histidine kinase
VHSSSWLKAGPLGHLQRFCFEFFKRLGAALQMPPPDAPEWLRRITIMERDIILPIKAVGIPMLFYLFYSSPWTKDISDALGVELEATRYFFWFYIAINAVVAVVLLYMRRLPLALVQWVVFCIGLVDGIFLSTLALATGGYNSIVYWLFLVLIVRSAVSVPRGTSQVALNLTLCACFMLAGFIDVFVAESVGSDARTNLRLQDDYPAEPIVLRMSLLLFMTVCCYGVQVLLERQRRVIEEAREFAMREGQLRSAGRLAAEFAHQIKNPLAIINTAAFSLQRALKNKQAEEAAEQIRMIQEEVERSDRIITQIMGYAQLSEGHVERLNVPEELDHAIERVFPPAAHYPVSVHRDYTFEFPALLMQRRHVTEAFINVLQNAREALGTGGGNVYVKAWCNGDYAIEVSIEDDGPGIPPDKCERVFEAYYTTKEKGTGLGLATVKHNLELYGGAVRLESKLGKGARFVLSFPARTLTKPPGRQ